MTSQASFTTHAFDRVRSRLSLTTVDVADLLDSDRVILIGREKNSSRIHRLFYSKPDGYCFVAVQDEETGEVVTVMPADYRKAFAVSEDATEMAKRIIMGPPVLSPIDSGMVLSAKHQEMSLRFKCAFTHRGESKGVDLGACVIRFEEKERGTRTFLSFVEHPGVRVWLNAKLAELIPAGANKRELSVRFKCTGKQTAWTHVRGFFEEEFL